MTPHAFPPKPGVSEQPTLSALLTAPAPGAIAVVALSGPQTESILDAVLRRPSQRVEPAKNLDAWPVDTGSNTDDAPILAENRPTLCRIVDGSETIDDAIVVLIRRGNASSAEICTHGGVRVTQRVLTLLAANGAIVVEPDELPSKMSDSSPIIRDVDQALLRSRSRRMSFWLLHQREALPPFLARFGDLSASDQVVYHRRTEAAIRLMRGLTVAIVGPPNAGKSTLANRLIGHDRVITSDRPGTTRDWVAETALINGWPVTLTDTAGIRESHCVIESEAIRRGREQAIQADLVLLVLDATTPPTEQLGSFRQVADFLPSTTPRLLVFNKCERTPSTSASIANTPSCSISALQGVGVVELENRTEMLLGLDQLRDDLPTGFMARHLGVASAM